MRRILLGLLASKILISSVYAGGYSIEPWILILEPAQKKMSQVITVKYEGGSTAPKTQELGPSRSDPVPVEISVVKREIALDGTISYPTEKQDDDFVVYPSQLILYPGDLQKVQVQWVGSKIPSAETVYGLIAMQLPINLPVDENVKTPIGSMNLLTRYEGIVVMRPAGIKPQVNVDTSFALKDSAGNTHLISILNNKGNGLLSFKKLRLTVIPLDEKGKLHMQDKIEVKPDYNQPYAKQALFAGNVRRFDIPWPKDFPIGPIKAFVVYDSEN